MRKCSFTIKHKRGNSSSLINYLCFLLKAFHVQSSRAWDGHISQGLNLLAQPMVRFGKWSAGRADFRCLALWGLFWQEETMIVQLLSQTAPRNHNQNSHLQGKGRGKGGKNTHFYFFYMYHDDKSSSYTYRRVSPCSPNIIRVTLPE